MFVLSVLVTTVLVVLRAWRWTDLRAERAVWASLVALQPSSPAIFDYAMLENLPAAAQRYFRFAIRPGTPLTTLAEISMVGELGLGTRSEPAYQPMCAQQILAAPHGFVWQVRAGKGVMRMSGSDVAAEGSSWSRFWLLQLVPLARVGANPDHARSAFGRCIAEAVFWTPAALLPGKHVVWEQVDESTARVTLTHKGMQQSVDLTVESDGRLSKVSFQRWSNANSAREYRLQPFGGYLSEYRDFGGFRLPTRVEAGNFFGTDDYFGFFRVDVTSVRFPVAVVVDEQRARLV